MYCSVMLTPSDLLVGLPKPGTQLSDRFAAGVNINQVTLLYCYGIVEF